MNTQPPDSQYVKAMELALQRRREPLPDEDEAFLQQYLVANPAAAAEVQSLSLFQESWGLAQIPVSPEFRSRLQNQIAQWDHAARGTPSPARAEAPSGFWTRLWGRTGVARHSLGTLILARSLAIYLGVAMGLWVATSFRPISTYDNSEARAEFPIPSPAEPSAARRPTSGR